LTVEDLAGEGVAGFDAVELGEDAASVGLVIEVGEQVEGLGDPAELGDGTPGGGGPAAALQDAEDFAGADGAGGQAAGDAEQACCWASHRCCHSVQSISAPSLM